MTVSLPDFLLARIAEDEAVARRVAEFQGNAVGSWTVASIETFVGATWLAEHIARHDPARILAECEAKRRIVDHHAPQAVDEFWLCAICTETGPDAQAWPCLTLRLLALPHASHPDYDEAWRA